MAGKRTEKKINAAAPTGILLILVGLLTVPFIRELVGRILLFTIIGGMVLIFLVFVVGGLLLVTLRGAN